MEAVIEELAEYTTNRPDREIIGVEKKLENGGREDLIDNAICLKKNLNDISPRSSNKPSINARWKELGEAYVS